MPAAIETKPPPAPIPRRNATRNRPPRPGEQMTHHVVSCHEERETYDKTRQSDRQLRTLCKKRTANDSLGPQNDNLSFLSRKSNPASCHKAPKNFSNIGPIWPLRGIRYPIDTLSIPPKTPQPVPIRPIFATHPVPSGPNPTPPPPRSRTPSLATGYRPLATAVPSNEASQRAAMNNVREGCKEWKTGRASSTRPGKTCRRRIFEDGRNDGVSASVGVKTGGGPAARSPRPKNSPRPLSPARRTPPRCRAAACAAQPRCAER